MNPKAEKPLRKGAIVVRPVKLFQAILGQLLRRKTGDGFEQALGYRFRDPELLAQAMVHRSWIVGRDLEYWQTNERLEFLGDSVLNMLVTEYLYRAYPTLSEGELSKKKSALVSGRALAESARLWNLGEYLRVGKGEAKAGGRERESLLADGFESVIGAVYLDGGLDACRRVLERSHFRRIDEILNDAEYINFKSQLLELAQAKGFALPEYRVVQETGPEHQKNFLMEVLVGGEFRGRGQGSSKKKAEQEAARQALEWLKLQG